MISTEPILDTDENMPTDWDTSDYRNDVLWAVWYQRNAHSSPILLFTGAKYDAIRYRDWKIAEWG